MGVWCGPLTWHHLMADLETEWAGVLQRWGNSSEASLRQSDSLYRQTNTSDRQTYTKTHTESHARQSSSTRRNEYDRNSSYSSNNDNLDRPKSVTADRRLSLRQEDSRETDHKGQTGAAGWTGEQGRSETEVGLCQQGLGLSWQGECRNKRIQVPERHQVSHQQAVLQHSGQQGQADHTRPD